MVKVSCSSRAGAGRAGEGARWETAGVKRSKQSTVDSLPLGKRSRVRTKQQRNISQAEGVRLDLHLKDRVLNKLMNSSLFRPFSGELTHI